MVSNLLKISLHYAIEVHKFNKDEYFIEDVTAIIADCAREMQTRIKLMFENCVCAVTFYPPPRTLFNQA